MKEQRIIMMASLRADGEGKPKIVGYASVFDKPTKIRDWFGEFTEVVRPGAFTAALEAQSDVRALVDHDPVRILGRWPKPGTLQLSQDATGLRMEIVPPDTQAGRDIVESIRRGDVSGASFGFQVRAGGDKWTKVDGEDEQRELTDLDLFDVSVVTFPAYESTSVGLRAAIDLSQCRTIRPWRGHEAEARRRAIQLAR